MGSHGPLTPGRARNICEGLFCVFCYCKRQVYILGRYQLLMRRLPGVDLAILHTRSHLYNPLFRDYAGIGFVGFLSGTTYNCVLIH